VAHSFVALVYPGLTPFFGSAGLTVAQVAAILVPEAALALSRGGSSIGWREIARFAPRPFWRVRRLLRQIPAACGDSRAAGMGLWRLHQSFAVIEAGHWAVALVAAVLVFISDVAEVRLVVEDRRSALGALARLSDSSAAASAPACCSCSQPGRRGRVRVGFQIASTAAPWWLSLVMLSGWTFLAVSARLVCLGSAVVFFQGELAHAGYTAAAPRQCRTRLLSRRWIT